MSPASQPGPHAPPPLDPQDLLAMLRDWAERLADGGDKAIDAYLDQRDRAPFDEGWTRADAALQRHKQRLDIERVRRAQAESERLRQAVFVAAMQAGGHAELAAYLADDAAMIYENEVLSLCSDWIDALHERYRSDSGAESGASSAAAAAVAAAPSRGDAD